MPLVPLPMDHRTVPGECALDLRDRETMIEELILATANEGKVKEYRALLSSFCNKIISVADLGTEIAVEESGSTFKENAVLKARAVAAATGLPTLADDSGLKVLALGGRPGIHSARYAGMGASDADNVEKLLGELGGVPDRRARFVCTIVLLGPGGHEISVEGCCNGTIALAPGGSGGFGYDPVFIPEGGIRTMAELPAEEKNAISHRGKATRALTMYLEGRRVRASGE